jgi:subtilisin family serine protease
VVISAPGVNVIGAGPGGSYLQGSGTSPASAFVAGVAALIRSRYSRLSPVQVEQAMISSADHRPSGGYSPDVGFGEVNAPAALSAAARLAATAPASGLAAGARFGSAPGPIQVVHRDKARIDGYGAAGAVLALAGLFLLTWVFVHIRRFRSGKRELGVTLLCRVRVMS